MKSEAGQPLTPSTPMLKLEQLKRRIPCRLPKHPMFQPLCAMLGALLAVTGCGHSSVITTRGGGHPIRAVIAGNHSIDTQPERATITSAFGTVTVEHARVRIDSAPWNRIPEAVPVELRISKGMIALTAGPVTIKQTRN